MRGLKLKQTHMTLFLPHYSQILEGSTQSVRQCCPGSGQGRWGAVLLDMLVGTGL